MSSTTKTHITSRATYVSTFLFAAAGWLLYEGLAALTTRIEIAFVTIPVAAMCLLASVKLSRIYACSCCGTKFASARVKLCVGCGARFGRKAKASASRVKAAEAAARGSVVVARPTA